MVTLLFKPIEALHFGGFGEFNPTVRGPAALGKVLTMPLPTTILGLLAYLNKDKVQSIEKPLGTLGADYEILEKVFKISEFYIRGPYLIIDNDVYFVIDNLVINLSNPDMENGIYRYIAYTFAKVLGKEDEVKEYTERLFENQLSIIKFLGIGLKRGLKIPDEDRGLLYLSEYIDYVITGHLEKKYHDTYIAIDINKIDLSKLKEELKDHIGKPVRLGGESRIALMLIKEDVKTFEKICKAFLDKESKNYLLIHITPVIINVRVDKKDKMYINIEELKKHLFRNYSENLELIGIIGKFGKDPLGIVGLGFNEIKKVKRPLKIAVMSGSISIVKDVDTKILENLCEEGVGDDYCDGIECYKIGFGTILPISLEKLPTNVKGIVDELIKILECTYEN